MRGITDVDHLRIRNSAVEGGVNPYEYKDVDCSGRSLATLMVAWVGAAMVASVLLRWKYMWIALMILTLLFLFACGYAACNARRAHERAIANEEARFFERRRRERNIQSVSGSMDNCPEISEPPAYQAYWITDLPPPYAVVIGAEPVSSIPPPPPMPNTSNPDSLSSSHSSPPPYSIAIQSNLVGNVQNSNPRNQAENLQSRSFDEASNSARTTDQTSGAAWEESAKITTEISRSDSHQENQVNNSQTVLSTGSQYLSNIISCTFGRGQRRGNNTERNQIVNPTNSTTTDRLAVIQLSNQDNANGATENSSTL